MRKLKYIFIILIMINILTCTVYSKNFTNITSSTFFSQDILNNTSDIEVFTEKDIKLLGIENIPELLNFASGIFVNRVNGATAEIYTNGFIPQFRYNPIILLDGMEISENFYNRTYLYNIPVIIDDIDRVEIIKNSNFSNGYIAPEGIINIVTKQAQYLDNNYLTSTIGSNDLKKYNFSLNGYNLSTYWKLTGEYRGIDDYEHNKRIDKSKLINFSADKYIGKSKFFVKSSISENNLDFLENYLIGINHKEYNLSMHEKSNNLLIKNFLINYKYPDIDTSFYYQNLTGYVKLVDINGIYNAKYNNELYKYSFRYSHKKFFLGLQYKYYHMSVNTLTYCYDYYFAPFFEYGINLPENITFNFTLKNDFIRNNGSNFNYKFYLLYKSDDKSLKINLGHSKSIKPTPMYSKYTNYNSIIPLEHINIPTNLNLIVNLHGNKNLHPEKIYSTDFTISKKWDKFFIKTGFFYHRVINIIGTTGSLQISIPSVVNLYNINFMKIDFKGMETELKYNINNNFKLLSSYIFQESKNLTYNKYADYYFPKQKFTGVFLFDSNRIFGSLTTSYVSTIKSYSGGESDDVLKFNFNIGKKFLKDKMEISLHVENLFNKVYKETYYGENIDRLIYLKLKYNF